MMKFVRVNMMDKTVTFEEAPEKYKGKAGRWLTSLVVSDEVPADCHPLGPNNKIVIAPGMVTGTSAPSSGRLSVGGKSPLTGGIKEANAGSPFAQKMARMGIQAIVVEGQGDGTWMLKLGVDRAELVDAAEYAGMGLYQAADKILAGFGEKTAFMGVGPTGEKRMAMAGIAFNDTEGRPSRYAGRGGLGAVLGSKGLKFILLDDDGAPGVPIADKEVFRQGSRKLVKGLGEHAITKPGGGLNTLGTALLINVLNEAGGLPTRNFRTGTFEGAQATSGEALAEKVKERGGAGMMGHGCHPGCVIRCSNVYPKEDGTEHVSCVEYESDWAFGANCGIDDLDIIAELVRLSNDYGVDTIEAGVTIGVAMEAGIIQFGDGQGAIQLMHEVGKGTPLGHILGQGAEFTGKAYGMTRIPTVKRQGMPAYEPRAVKGIGITYATTPMGADHTAGYTIAPEIASVGGKVDPLDPKDKSKLSRDFQATTAFLDATGYCLFTSFAILDLPEAYEGFVESVNGVLGTGYTVDDVVPVGMEILNIERDFNTRAGFTKMDDRMPEFMRYETLPPHNHVFDVTDEDLDKVWEA